MSESWAEDVQSIVSLYKTDPEIAHDREDDLLWGFVRWEAEELDNPVARELLALHHTERTRWYA